MTEKRFIGCFEGDMLVSIKDTVTDRQLNILQIVEIANKIYDENEQLKLRNKQYSMMVNGNSDLNDEIYEQLQKTEKALKRVCEENEKLKKEIEEHKAVINREWNKYLKKHEMIQND